MSRRGSECVVRGERPRPRHHSERVGACVWPQVGDQCVAREVKCRGQERGGPVCASRRREACVVRRRSKAGMVLKAHVEVA